MGNEHQFALDQYRPFPKGLWGTMKLHVHSFWENWGTTLLWIGQEASPQGMTVIWAWFLYSVLAYPTLCNLIMFTQAWKEKKVIEHNLTVWKKMQTYEEILTAIRWPCKVFVCSHQLWITNSFLQYRLCGRVLSGAAILSCILNYFSFPQNLSQFSSAYSVILPRNMSVLRLVSTSF